jgi:hypothetical protein
MGPGQLQKVQIHRATDLEAGDLNVVSAYTCRDDISDHHCESQTVDLARIRQYSGGRLKIGYTNQWIIKAELTLPTTSLIMRAKLQARSAQTNTDTLQTSRLSTKPSW